MLAGSSNGSRDDSSAERPTLNIEHPTPNDMVSFDVGRSMLDVRCSRFDFGFGPLGAPMRATLLFTAGFLIGLCPLQAQEKKASSLKVEKVLFDFEGADELAGWESLVLPDAKYK